MSSHRQEPLSAARISHVFILVRDLEAMLTFYRDVLGFEVVYTETGVCAFLQLDDRGPRIALYSGRAAGDGSVAANHWFIVIDVADVDAAVARLLALDVTVSAIQAVPHGRAVTLTDPEGNVLEFHQPVAG